MSEVRKQISLIGVVVMKPSGRKPQSFASFPGQRNCSLHLTPKRVSEFVSDPGSGFARAGPFEAGGAQWPLE